MNVRFDAREIREDNAVEYQHKTNVHYLPSAHAVRNAAQAALLVEADRRQTRMAEIEELLVMYQAQRDSLNAAIFTLENEYELQRKAKP
jgi:hypothetical protein